MEKKSVSYFVLEGNHQEIGRQMALKTRAKAGFLKAPETFTDLELKEALTLYNQYCPGIIQELEGYGGVCHGSINDIAYTWMTYLLPRCSGLIVEGSLMADGNTKLIRNYEFDLDHEDLIVFETKPEDRYAHIGGSVVLFGRSEGINECGLAISMASCGLPVSNISEMRPPKIKGLQFWAVIRSLLENCKDVNEALTLAKEMPIAYNINLFLADASGNGCILETMDGELSYKSMDSKDYLRYLCATNHIAIPSFQHLEPYAMKNSLVRLQTLENFMGNKSILDEGEICDLFVKKYPQGMSTSYYEDFFGTIKTVVMDTKERTFKIRWFIEEENGWEIYQVGNNNKDHTLEKVFTREKPSLEFFERVNL